MWSFFICKFLFIFTGMKEELKNKMLQSGEIHRPDRFNSNWIAAFELYKTMTGDTHVSLKCGSCINKIKEWLLK